MGKTAGILGGMGPEATIDFMARVLATTTARRDQEHIRMLVDHNPPLPDRHEAIAGGDAGLGPQLAAMARGLEHSGADFLVMVCNTAHAFAADIVAAVSIPFISIIDVTLDALPPSGASPRVGVMAAQGCLQAELYQRALEERGYLPVLWSEEELARFMDVIYRVKAGERDAALQAAMLKLAEALLERGAGTLVAGCTEIPLLLSQEQVAAPLLSSTDLLVRRTVALAKGDH